MRISRLEGRQKLIQRRRRRFFEALEPRLLLTSAWQSPSRPLDVNDDGDVSPLDALVGINRINEVGSGALPTPATPPPYYDTNGDGEHSPLDILVVINALNGGAQFQLALTQDTGPGQSTNNDFITSDARVMGSVSASFVINSVTVALDGSQEFALPLDVNGDFVLEPDLAVDGADDGSHELLFTSLDEGNRSATGSLSFVLDTQGPTLAAAPAIDTAPGGGTNSDNVTSNALIVGSASDALSDIFGLQAAINQQPTADVPVTQAGAFTVSLSELPDGLHAVRLLSEDGAGNLSELTVNISLDRQQPQLATMLETDTAPGGTTNGDAVTSIPSIVGTVSDATSGVASVQARLDAGEFAAVVPDAQGAFRVEPSLAADGSADGQHEVLVLSEDQAGNVNQQTVLFTLDTQGPSIAAGLAEDTAAGSGTNTDGITSNPEITGSVSDALSEVVSFVAIIDQQAPSDVVVDGAGAFSLSLAAFSDGPHAVRLLAEDTAGNTSEMTVQIQLDRGSPQLDAMLENDTAAGGQTNSDGVTSDPAIVGTIQDGTSVSLEIALDNGSFGALGVDNLGAFRATNNNLAEGPHVAHLRAEDQVGNVTLLDVPFTLDTVAPTIDTFGLAPEQAQPDGSTELKFVTLVGTTEPNIDVELSPGGFQTVSDQQGQFQFTNYALEVGINDLTARAIDAAGNSSDRQDSITRTSEITFELEEAGRFVTEASELVQLGQNAGTRQLRFTLDEDFDASDSTSPLGDVLLVYLLDPQDPSQTLLDGGMAGAPLLELREDGADFRAGLVTFDGFTAEIEVSSLEAAAEGLLLFQLISHDTDTDSRVTVGKIANELDADGIASPIFPPSVPPLPAGPPITDLASLQPSQDLRPIVENVRLESQTGRYAAELRIQNEGDNAARQVAAVLSNLDASITMSNRSGTTGGGAPYVNMSAAMPSGGLAAGEISKAVAIEFDNPNLLPLSLFPQLLVGTTNAPPVFSALGAITIQPGGFFEQQLSAFDPDGDAITFSIASNGPIPTGQLDADGNLVITPYPDDLGNFTFSVQVTDGTEVVSQDVVVNVVPSPDPTMTIVEGTILDVDEDPLGGVPVELDDIQTVTEPDGSFLFEFDEPLEDSTLMIFGDQLNGAEDYPFVAEGLELVLGHEVFEGTTNVIGKPIFLPAIDTANAVPIDPGVTTTVTTPAIPNAAVVVQAGSAMDGQQLFQGSVSITEVPVDRTPAALPTGLSPGLVVTIQPAQVQFTTPAPLSLPNDAGYPPGTLLDLQSINPDTGTFDVVGTGVVSNNGTVIDTISGGIRNSSWHFFTPPPAEPADPNTNVRNQQGLCEDCAAVVVGSSEVELHSGALRASHELVSYQSLGVGRGLTLEYDSLRADPRPIIHFGYDNVQADPVVRLAANLVIKQGDFGIQVAGRPSRDLNLSSAENYWSIPAAGGDIDVALQAELRGQPSGRYEYTLTSGLLRENNGRLAGSRSTVQGNLLHVDASDSPFGVGWGLAGLQELVSNLDGSVLLIDGDGSELLYEPPASAGQPFISPAGDFAVLTQMPDDTFRRTLTDQTVYAFDASNRLASITDRNNNQTLFTYTGDRLTMITDPVGLETTFSYTGDRITGITDPASRTTVLEYDTAGNLTRIIDPDTEDRTFEYDDRNLLTAEITKRDFREETVYDFAGRVISRMTGDGAEIEIASLQTQELLVPAATQEPFAAPDAFLQSVPIAFHTDGNGNTFATELDQFGQRVFSFDGEGSHDRIERNAQNLVTSVTDALGFTTQYQYDALGNLTAIIRGSSGGGASATDAFDLGFLDAQRTVTGHVGTLDPVDFYRLELEETSRVEVRLEDLFEGATLSLIADVNGNEVVDSGEVVEARDSGGPDSVFLTEDLGPGSYLVRVEPETFPGGENTSYTLVVAPELLSVTTPGDPAGNALAASLNAGTLSSKQTFVDWVGITDTSDFYRFDVSQDNTPVWIRLSELAESADLRLIQDANGDGTVNSGETIATSDNSGTTADQIFARLDAGTYFAQVLPDTFPNGEDTVYTLELEAVQTPATTPHVDSGNFLGNAMNVGVLDGNVGVRGSIGGADSDDFVRFTLTDPARVRLELTGLSEHARLELVADIDGDLQIDSADQIETSQVTFDADPEWLDEELAPGDYFARVYQHQFDDKPITNYNLVISSVATPSSTGSDPGESFGTALSIDPFTGPQTFRENVGALDQDDYYRFTLDSAATVSARLTELNENLGVGVVADFNGNGLHDSQDTLEFFTDGTKGQQRVVEDLAPGTYFFWVFQRTFAEDENSHYVLNVDITPFVTTPAEDPGNNFAAALVIDPFVSPQTLRESVGALDNDDYYRFTLDRRRPSRPS